MKSLYRSDVVPATAVQRTEVVPVRVRRSPSYSSPKDRCSPSYSSPEDRRSPSYSSPRDRCSPSYSSPPGQMQSLLQRSSGTDVETMLVTSAHIQMFQQNQAPVRFSIQMLLLPSGQHPHQLYLGEGRYNAIQVASMVDIDYTNTGSTTCPSYKAGSAKYYSCEPCQYEVLCQHAAYQQRLAAMNQAHHMVVKLIHRHNKHVAQMTVMMLSAEIS